MFKNKIYNNSRELLAYILREYNSGSGEDLLISPDDLVDLLTEVGAVEHLDGIAFAKERK